MKTLEFKGRKVIAVESEDFVNWNLNIVGAIDVLLVPREHMKDFPRDGPLQVPVDLCDRQIQIRLLPRQWS